MSNGTLPTRGLPSSTSLPVKAYDCPKCGGPVFVGLVHHCSSVPMRLRFTPMGSQVRELAAAAAVDGWGGLHS